MKYAILSIFLSVATVSTFVTSPYSQTVYAESLRSGVIIAQVAPNGENARQEYVSLYNNSDSDVDVTGWCVQYNNSSSKPGCITAPSPEIRMVLKARSFTTFASNEFVEARPGFVPQARQPFSAGLADGGGTISLVDAGGIVQDQFAWGKKLPEDYVYQRQSDNNSTFMDTDDDSTDFAVMPLLVPDNPGLYELVEVVDVCPNIVGAQESMPIGYERDEQGDCIMIITEALTIDITELYPNPPSYDTGQEYIELYNPNDQPVLLQGYSIQLGPAYTRTFMLPEATIQPRTYLVFTDNDLGFTLSNASGSARLLANSGEVVSETPQYTDAPEAESWAVVGSEWKFTTIITPAAANQLPPPAEEAVIVDTSSPKPCPAGKYRNPLTNRCKNITQTNSNPKPCDADQYRNTETGRCRKLSVLSSMLTPCKPGQTRNPDTNRCRSSKALSTTQKPCKDGYERNPETNRCRKSLGTKSSLPQGADATQSANNTLTMIVLIVTLGYAAYEYRHDVANLYKRMKLRSELKRTS